MAGTTERRAARLAGALLLAAPLAALGQPPAETASAGALLHVSAKMVDDAHVLACEYKPWVEIRLDRLTPDDEDQFLAELFRLRGPVAVERTFEELFLGSYELDFAPGVQISYARAERVGDHVKYVLLARRPRSFTEVVTLHRSRDYPYVAIFLELDDEGRGTGELFPAAKLRLRDDDQIELLNFTLQPIRLVAVQRVDSESAGERPPSPRPGVRARE